MKNCERNDKSRNLKEKPYFGKTAPTDSRGREQCTVYNSRFFSHFVQNYKVSLFTQDGKVSEMKRESAEKG